MVCHEQKFHMCPPDLHGGLRDQPVDDRSGGFVGSRLAKRHPLKARRMLVGFKVNEVDLSEFLKGGGSAKSLT